MFLLILFEKIKKKPTKNTRNAAKLQEKRTLETQLSKNQNFCISKYQYMYKKNNKKI